MNKFAHVLSLTVLTLVWSQTSQGEVYFSLDIGSDTEVSDPLIDAGEEADPGDIYVSSQVAGSLVGAAPALDDAALFGGIDPPPVQNAPATAAPIGVAGLLNQFFDIDGYDAVSARLSNFDLSPNSPLESPLLRATTPIDCVYVADQIALSYSDDSVANWGAPVAPRIPVEGPSPMGFLYGTTTGQDEVIAVELDITGGFPATLLTMSGVRDEETVHVDLAPNPTFGSVDTDDDVDALDKRPQNGCEVHYFSVDSEGRANLNPGAIYSFSGAGAPSLALQPFHFGLNNGVNIDAFEFAWLPTPQGLALAVVFSVQPDDPLSANDESGGLVPSTVYASFMTGTSFELLNGPANAFDNVDALAVPPPSEPSTDSDGDGVTDDLDNCTLVANPGQEDANGDGIGNLCDADYNDDCSVSFPDLVIFRNAFLGNNPVVDHNGDGVVNLLDFVVLRDAFLGVPGPAAAPNDCDHL